MSDIHPDLPALFDLDYGDFSDDLPFYENLARRCDGPVLELGVGAGRVAIPMAEAGFEVWGIDVSEAMLALARTKARPEIADRLHLARGDMRDFRLDERFNLVFAGLGGFHHLLTPGDQLACLARVREHLNPGGLFVCDLRPLMHEDWEVGDSAPLLHDWTRPLPGTGELVVKQRSVQADPASQIKHVTTIYDRLTEDGEIRRVVAEVDLRFTTRYEMEGLMHQAGLQLDQVYGDFDLTPYEGGGEYMITVALRPKEKP